MPSSPVPAHVTAAAEVRRRMRPGDVGGLWLVFFDDRDRLLLCLTVDEGMRHTDVLFRRHLADLIRHVDADRVVLAVHRPDAVPTRTDRAVWRDVCERLRDVWPQRIDLLLVGDDDLWLPRRCRTAA